MQNVSTSISGNSVHLSGNLILDDTGWLMPHIVNSRQNPHKNTVSFTFILFLLSKYNDTVDQVLFSRPKSDIGELSSSVNIIQHIVKEDITYLSYFLSRNKKEKACTINSN